MHRFRLCHLYETLGYKTSYHDKWEVENGVILVYEVMEKIRPEDIGQERPKKVWRNRVTAGKTEIFAPMFGMRALINRLTPGMEKVGEGNPFIPVRRRGGTNCGIRTGGIKRDPHLLVAAALDGFPAAFMGIGGSKLEMLFILPEQRGKVWEAGCSGMESDDTGLMKSV